MTTAYTSLLGLALPVTGELSGTWGDTVDNGITQYVDAAVAGTQSITGDSNVTLSLTNGNASATNLAQVGGGTTGSAQYSILNCTGARTAIRTITVPAQSKIYTVINSTTGGYSVKVVGAGPTAGVTIIAGEAAQIAWNGTDFVKVSELNGDVSFRNVTVATLTDSSLTSGRVTYAGTAGLLQDSANLLFNGTTLTANTLNLTNALGTLYGGTGLTSFTANGVVYASSTSALATGSALTFDGTSGLGVGGNSTFAISGDGTGVSGLVVQAAKAALRIWGTTGTNQFFDIGVGGGQATIGAYYSSLPNINYDAYTAHIYKISGSEQMRLTSTGLGIGTSSPGSKLEVNGSLTTTADASGLTTFGRFSSGYAWSLVRPSSTATGIEFRTNAGDALYQLDQTSSANKHIWYTGAAERMRLDSAGNLGLGVTPSAWGSSYKAFDVNSYGNVSASTGALNTTGNAYNNNTNWIYKSTAPASLYSTYSGLHTWWNAPSGTAGNAITFTQAMTLTASGELLIGRTSASGLGQLNTAIGADLATDSGNVYLVRGGGNVGIGTSSPSFKLDVQSPAATAQLQSTTGTNTVQWSVRNTGGTFYQAIDSSTGGNFTGSAYAGVLWHTGAYPIVFATSNGERMRLDSSGNLGIGTSSPSYKLDVVGTVQSNGAFVIGANVSGPAAKTWFGSDGADGAFLNYKTGKSFSIYINNATQVANFDSAGNLGLGVTPSAWASSVRALELPTGAFYSFASGSVSNFYNLTNAYLNSAGNPIYKQSSFATQYLQTAGQHLWYNAPSGTAGDPITFTQAMTLDASGNLLVGTTSAGGVGFTAYSSGITRINVSGATLAQYQYSSSSVGSIQTDGVNISYNAASALVFGTNGSTERARIDSSGNLLIGTTSAAGRLTVRLDSTTAFPVDIINAAVTGTFIRFEGNGSVLGSITFNGSTTSYNITSDYRLKDIAGPVTNSGAFIDKLNPVQGSWKSDGSRFIGFLAHELQEASETVVGTGVKDGEEMQSIDYSNAELIANLVAELKSLRKRLAAAGIA